MIKLLPVLCTERASDCREDSVYFLRLFSVSVSNPFGCHQEILIAQGESCTHTCFRNIEEKRSQDKSRRTGVPKTLFAQSSLYHPSHIAYI
jgi:hypothetical protein